MKHFFYFILFGLLLVNSLVVSAQRKSIFSLTILNEENNKPVKEALVLLYQASDSSLIKIINADDKGKAILIVEKKMAGYVLIQTDSFVTKKIYLPSPTRLDTIKLYKPVEGQEIIVKAALPITYKNDTLSFNDTYFKRDSLRTAEEIIKRFPGVVLLRDGGIEMNGIKISEILLDGQPLPANDIKTLMQTLQGSLLDRIQFIDRRTDEARLSGINNGIVEKVMNIKLKAKNKKMYSQAIHFGYGNEDKFEGKNNLNFITNKVVLSSNVNFNNTGRSNYSNINYANQNGVNTGLNGNITLRITASKKLIINNTINFGKIKNNIIEAKERTLFFTDSVNYFNQNLTQKTNNRIIGLTGGIYVKPDSLQEYRLTYTTNNINNSNERNEIVESLNNAKNILNKGSRSKRGNLKNTNLKLNWLSSNSTRNKKLVFFTTLNYTLANPEDTIYQRNNISFFRFGSLIVDTLNQRIFTNTNTNGIRGNASLNYSPIKAIRFHIGAMYNNVDNPSQRNALQYNYITQQYEIVNATLTNNLDNTVNTISQNAGIQFNFSKHNINLSVTNNTQKNTNRNKILDTTFVIENKFILPSVNYNFVDKKINISLISHYTQRAPTSLELQPIIDNSNPLLITKGNPNLKNEKTFYNSFNILSKPNIKNTNYNINGSAIFTKNKIANNTIYDPIEARQLVTPTNLPNNYLATLNTQFGKTNPIYRRSLTTTLNLAFRKDNNFFNGQINELNSISANPKIGFKLDNRKIYITANVGYFYQKNTYSLRPTQNIVLTSITNDIAITLFAIKNVEFSIDYDQFINSSRGKVRRINNLNSSLLYNFGKRKQTSVILSAFDVFNQNSNVKQTTNDYYEDFIVNNAVRRYFLLSFSYRFSKAFNK